MAHIGLLYQRLPSFSAGQAYVAYAEKQGSGEPVSRLLTHSPKLLNKQAGFCRKHLDYSLNALSVDSVEKASLFLKTYIGHISAETGPVVVVKDSSVLSTTESIANKVAEEAQGSITAGKDVMLAVQLVGVNKKDKLEQRTAFLYPAHDDQGKLNYYVTFSVLDREARDNISQGLSTVCGVLNVISAPPILPDFFADLFSSMAAGFTGGLTSSTSLHDILTKNMLSSIIEKLPAGILPDNVSKEHIAGILKGLFPTEQERRDITLSQLLTAVEAKVDYPVSKVKGEQLSNAMKDIFDVACLEFKGGEKGKACKEGIKRLVITTIYPQ